jgi:hypothetical protein
LIGGFGPLRQRIRVNADFEVFSEDGYVLSQIEAVAKLSDGGVALRDLGNRRWRQEPCGEGIFTHSGPGEREKLEEAGLTEEVEVGGVEAGVSLDALSGLTSANPAIFDPSETVAIKLNSAFSAGTLTQHLGMENRDHEK